MVAHYLRKISGNKRHRLLNLRLARYLAFVAGATNAGGFLAVQQYTSHMSGIVASIGNQLVLGHYHLILSSLLALLSFLTGAACTAILVNWGKRKGIQSLFALPLVVEALLLVCFGLVGARLPMQTPELMMMTSILLCFLMGLHNALITKISGAEIRTTHVTGMVTDLGIELGKLFYWNKKSAAPKQEGVRANRMKMLSLFSLIASFLVGGIVGSMGFEKIGFLFTLPFAALLFILAIVPVWDDIVKPRKSP